MTAGAQIIRWRYDLDMRPVGTPYLACASERITGSYVHVGFTMRTSGGAPIGMIGGLFEWDFPDLIAWAPLPANLPPGVKI